MIVKTKAAAGTMESSDVLVTCEPNPDGGRIIVIDSPVLKLYEDQMLNAVNEALDKLDIADASLYLKDRGAIDCVIRARVMAASLRACGETYDWSLEDKEA